MPGFRSVGKLTDGQMERRVEAVHQGYAGGVGKSTEWRRIAGLPLRGGEAPDLTPLFARPDVPGRCGFVELDGTPCNLCLDGSAALKPIQSSALLEAERGGGGLLSIGVGHGKELTKLLTPHVFPNAGRALLLTKARLKKQLEQIDIPRYARHFILPLDRITVLAYEELSRASSTDLLDSLRPGLIVLNEGHAMRHPRSARTKRLFRYLEANPDTIVVVMSGTIANDSPRDFQHLAAAALRGGAPVPLQWRESEDWALALEEPNGRNQPLAPGALLDLMGPEVRAEEAAHCAPHASESAHGRELARRVFRRRLVATPGVVATEGDSYPGAIELYAVRWPLPPAVRAVQNELQKLWRIGDEEFADAKDVSRKMRELAQGFRYEWDWGPGGKDREWIDKRSRWNKVVREILSRRSEAGLDSPLLVAGAASRGELRDSEQAAYSDWVGVRGRWPQGPPVRTIWLSDFAIKGALTWLAELGPDAPGICWYEHQAVGEALRAAGATVFGAGDDGILGFRGAACCASVTAHGEGKNLQHFSRGLVLSPPANGSRWEQLIGRKARQGQASKEIVFEVCQINWAQQSAFRSALADAQFQQQALGQRQKLLAATRVGFEF